MRKVKVGKLLFDERERVLIRITSFQLLSDEEEAIISQIQIEEFPVREIRFPQERKKRHVFKYHSRIYCWNENMANSYLLDGENAEKVMKVFTENILPFSEMVVLGASYVSKPM